ncbi:GIY-YIG nuclease family protein [Streptomyces venezuelae]|uniref:GIY-YIG nuclease family protein n=1 Tax=Streptomyces venezuelae TaxID=54571 RepID=UPI00345499D3
MRTYVIGIEGSSLVKIGQTSVEPRERRGALQTGLPFELTLLWSVLGDYEAQLHERFAEYRVRGEWFDLSPLGDPLQVIQDAVKRLVVQSAIR